MMVMVKAFGYGNGGLEITKLLEHHKVDYLGVLLPMKELH
jgi:alanine racemase